MASPLARAPAIVGLLVLLAFPGCTQPEGSGALGDGSSTNPPGAVGPAATTLDYAGCRYFGVLVGAPKEDVQALLPEGFEADTGVTVFGSPLPPVVASLEVSFTDCPAPTLNGAPTAAPLRVLYVLAPVQSKDDAGSESNAFLLEHYVNRNADPAVVETFRAAGVPVTLADIAFDPTDAAEAAHASITVAVEGAASIQYDAFWKTHESPGQVLVGVRQSQRVHAVTDGVHVFFDDVPREKDQDVYVLPYTLRAQGGVLAKVGTGAAGLLAGVGGSRVLEGSLVFES